MAGKDQLVCAFPKPADLPSGKKKVLYFVPLIGIFFLHDPGDWSDCIDYEETTLIIRVAINCEY